jgi:hypothetical protein
MVGISCAVGAQVLSSGRSPENTVEPRIVRERNGRVGLCSLSQPPGALSRDV